MESPRTLGLGPDRVRVYPVHSGFGFDQKRCAKLAARDWRILLRPRTCSHRIFFRQEQSAAVFARVDLRAHCLSTNFYPVGGWVGLVRSLGRLPSAPEG